MLIVVDVNQKLFLLLLVFLVVIIDCYFDVVRELKVIPLKEQRLLEHARNFIAHT